uniref:Uncharacterized protein n=1 Tax=Arion vulgaris TaxID=1028688 RepID=A0A0B7B4F8_9EUPU
MQVSRNIRSPNICFRGTSLKQVKEFKYFRSMITEDGRKDRENANLTNHDSVRSDTIR